MCCNIHYKDLMLEVYAVLFYSTAFLFYTNEIYHIATNVYKYF